MSTRDRMVDAAAQVMRERGLAHATTKEIAKAAGFSEAALYKHFRDKTELFMAVLAERTPGELGALLAGLGERAGHGTVAETLTEVAHTAIRFYQHNFPMAAALFAEPTLFAAHRKALGERQAGPHHVSRAVADYLAAEQRLGRIGQAADPAAAAALLIGACLQHAFLGHFVDRGQPTASALVHTLLAGLA
ncbi:TetR/AcrR family transcriptional regulator [Actinocrispum wychmicini]|uniref:TetR family transcriptional regulator n=1 Tax=Actinocrispum wychmicini TaxID=1213861 RepID=A0A4V2S4N5_9PSEU|nr:TetR/AcrR family transcriptional regulator [Actinocrispum wychmicini]TCO48970.1 TetR family transcriptional regulator [Actinocrispum wychmicini]